MVVGDWSSSLDLRDSTVAIGQVKYFKHLRSWLLNCTKDVEISKRHKLGSLHSISRSLEMRLRLYSALKIKLSWASVLSTLLYNAVTWTLTDTLPRKVDTCHTKLLRYALNFKWSDSVTNNILYYGSEPAGIRLLEKLIPFCWSLHEEWTTN
jgi:hypothetical protein